MDYRELYALLPWGFSFFLLAVPWFLINVLFATGVYQDAVHLQQKGSRLYFVAPAVWGLATFLGGIYIAVVYWVFHHSALVRGERLPFNLDQYEK